jgi:hypothetical protein
MGRADYRFAEEERFWYQMRGDTFTPLPSEAFHTGPALQTHDQNPTRVSCQLNMLMPSEQPTLLAYTVWVFIPSEQHPFWVFKKGLLFSVLNANICSLCFAVALIRVETRFASMSYPSFLHEARSVGTTSEPQASLSSLRSGRSHRDFDFLL